MKNKIITYIHLEKSKIVLLLIFYIVFSELIKTGAEVYILEQSLELKLLLLSLVVVTLYKVPETVVIFSIIFLLFLSIFGIQTGFMIYVFIFYSFLKLLKSTKKFTNG